MQLRTPTEKEKKLLLEYYIKNHHSRKPSKEERQKDIEWVGNADIAVFDYNEGYKTMVVLWDSEAYYSETYTIERPRADDERWKKLDEINWFDGKHEQFIERAELEQAWELVDSVMDDKIYDMITKFQNEVRDLYASSPDNFVMRLNMARLNLSSGIVALKFPPHQSSNGLTFGATISDKEDNTKKYKKGYKFIYEHRPHVIIGFWEPGGLYLVEPVDQSDSGPIMQTVLKETEIDNCAPIGS